MKKLFAPFVFLLSTFVGTAQQATSISSMQTVTDEPFTYPALNPVDKSIVAQKKVGSYLQLFLLTPGAKQKQLTFDSADNKHAAISPGGKILAYTKLKNDRSDIHLFNLDDASDRNLTNSAGYSEAHPSWSGDTVIVFNTNRYDSLQEISLIHLATNEIKRLTVNKDEDTYGAIAPGARHLVYTKWLDEQKNAEIYFKALGDDKEMRITENTARDVAPVWLSDSVISYSRGGDIFFYNIYSQMHDKLQNDPGQFMLVRAVPAGDGKLLCEKIKNRTSAGLVMISLR